MDETRLDKLVAAFGKDRFGVNRRTGVAACNGRIGIRAEHSSAATYGTGKKKYALYVEGSHYEMGYLAGLLAEGEISRMTREFRDQVLFDFIRYKNDRSPADRSRVMGPVLMQIVEHFALNRNYYIPPEYCDEIRGMVAGCREANPETRVDEGKIAFLNIATDVLLAMIYSGRLPDPFAARVDLECLKVPVMCNSFSVFGEAAAGNHFFGRDFMFPTAGVFEHTACMTVRRPANGGRAFVGVGAPGFIGCVAAMNDRGVAAGVNMAPAANCDPDAMGMSSLLTVRYAVEHGATGEEAVDRIRRSPRSVSWIYPISDGANDRAYVVEAGRSEDRLDVGKYVPRRLLRRSLVPDRAFIEAHRTVEVVRGMAFRPNDYRYDVSYLDFNPGLWRDYRRSHPAEGRRLHDDAFDVRGYINRTSGEANCPATFYFAPLRVGREDVVIATNHFVIPEMRLCGMHPWVTRVFGTGIQDSQWRYDELNRQILETLEREGAVTWESAEALIDFLSPYRKFPLYYANKGRRRDTAEIVIEGALCLFDLKARKARSHCGYYRDEWTEITLPGYV